ncbi:hypothetical protein [Tsuneonella sp. SYSU-LHT278]|uniref:hypothetical protein n=1 Tax=Tsuneonella sediminis TaxID=3416089 RepID=UPI003F792078
MPANLASSTVRTEFAGIGSHTSGRYAAGPYSGVFDRSLEKWTFADTDIARAGHTYFSIAGLEPGPAVEGHCGMRERARAIGSAIEITTRPMTYRCEFTADGAPMGAWLELWETTGRGLAAFRYERRGEISLGSETVRFRSVHRIDGSSMPTITPVGYTFEHGGRDIGAIDLANRPALVVPATLDKRVERAVTVAALALATFWDPAIREPEA